MVTAQHLPHFTLSQGDQIPCGAEEGKESVTTKISVFSVFCWRRQQFYHILMVMQLFNHGTDMPVELFTLSALKEQEKNALLVNSVVALVLV